jgi:hypothetical protein
MGVTESDLLCLARSVASSMRADKLHLATLDEEMRISVVEAYVPQAVRNFEAFTAAYLTRDDVRNSVRAAVWTALTNKEISA